MIVGILFKGRLGNQLFQYVFLKFMREKHPNCLFFFPNPHHASIQKYFELEAEGILMESKIYSLLTRAIPLLLYFRDIHLYNFSAPREPNFKNRNLIHGYFQTDFFIQNMKEKPNLKIKQKYQIDFQKQMGDLFTFNKIIAVHIRRTDYLTYGKRDISIPISHFRRQLLSIANLEEYKVIFLSDDISYVKDQFGEQENFIYSNNNEITDFQILQHADISIISNSSFAWWACYLSLNPSQRVIAPKNWIGFGIGREHPRGVMTERFEWKTVE